MLRILINVKIVPMNDFLLFSTRSYVVLKA
jgi:hypothetical protein